MTDENDSDRTIRTPSGDGNDATRPSIPCPGGADSGVPVAGQTVGHYRLVELLGRGGMGVVFRAEDTRLGREVALKFLTPEATADEESRERFLREARAASRLDHPNICTIHEIDEADGRVFIAMALCPGRSLRSVVAAGALPFERAAGIVQQVAAALARAHGAGIVHRDVKPENVIVSDQWDAKLIDFGLARLTGQAQVTRTGVTLGTVGYMSPEQVRGGEVDSRSDVWSLGVLLYELATGQRPFRGERIETLMYQVLHEAPGPPSALRPGLPPGLDGIVARALAKDPAARFPSAAGLAEALSELCLPDSAAPRAPRARAVVGRRTVLALAVVAVLAAASIAGVLAIRGRGVPRRTGSVAVVPFLSAPGAGEEHYLAEGFSEALSGQLSRVGGIRVAAFSATRRYAGATPDPATIGRELDVGALVAGSARRDGERVVVEARLLDAGGGGRVLWRARFDRQAGDLLAIQDEIAREVAARVQGSARAAAAGAVPGPVHVEAYDLFLRGREYLGRMRKQDNEQAIELLRRAVELDPGRARAHAALAEAYARQFRYDYLEGSAFAASLESAGRALAIEPALPEAHRALAVAYQLKGWQAKAIDELHQAIRADPNFAAAMTSLGTLLARTGQLAAGLEWLGRGIERDPWTVRSFASAGDVCADLGLDAEAEAWYGRALELQPDLAAAHAGIVQLELMRGRRDHAGERLRRMQAAAPEDPSTTWLAGFVALLDGDSAAAKPLLERAGHTTGLAVLRLAEGDRAGAEAMLRAVITQNLTSLNQGGEYHGYAYTLAQAHALLGLPDEAFAYLDSAAESGFRRSRWVQIDPAFASLRREERMARFVARLDELVAAERRAVSRTGVPLPPRPGAPRSTHEQRPAGQISPAGS